MSVTDRLLEWPPWAFSPWLFVGVSVCVAALTLAAQCRLGWSNPATLALVGALMAAFGVVTIGRPVIRVGGYREWYARSKVIDGGHFEPTVEELREAEEGRKDAVAVQLVGPALVIFGTVLNGLSGLVG